MKKAICALCLAASLTGLAVGAEALSSPAPEAVKDPLAPWLDNVERVEPRDGISTNLSLMALALVPLGVAVIAVTDQRRR